MPQVIQEESLGGRLGTGLGSGIGSALDLLAQQKLNQLVQRQGEMRFSKALSGLGYTPEQAAFINAMPDKFKWEAALALRGAQPGAQQQSAQGEPSVQDLLQYLQGQQGEQQESQQPAYQQMTPEQMQQEAISSGQIKPLTANQYLDRLMASQAAPAQAEQAAPKLAPLSPPEPFISKLPKPEVKAALADKFPGYLSKEERAAAHREKLARSKEEARERSERFKITQGERKELADKARSAKNVLADLDRFEELEKEGKLDTPGYVEFLQRAGLDIPALMNPGSEEFNKIANNFVRDAKNYYGGRVSNFEVEQFLKTVPSLSQSPEGRKRVIANLRRLNQGAVEYFNTAREITKENDGVPPYDLSEQVEERIEPKLNKLADRFKEDLKKKVPAGQNKLITALQASTGSLAGGLKKVGTGALLGGALGGLAAGPAGAAAGARLGAGLGGATELIRNLL